MSRINTKKEFLDFLTDHPENLLRKEEKERKDKSLKKPQKIKNRE